MLNYWKKKVEKVKHSTNINKIEKKCAKKNVLFVLNYD